MKYSLEIKKNRGWFAIYAGAAKLSRSFRSASSAEAELDKNRGYYRVWSNSMSVAYENRIAEGDFTLVEVKR